MTKHQYAFFLGSHPDLSAAESWAALQRHQLAPQVLTSSTDVLLVTLAKPVPEGFINRLGGVDRIAEVVGHQPRPWTSEALWTLLSPTASDQKVTLGISCLDMPPRTARTLGQAIKTLAKAQGIRLRFITPSARSGRLNSAQVLFNGLYRSPNAELTLMRLGEDHFVFKTIQVQDIAAYEQRDTARPARDARVGMLPPKLAQIMLNLATASLPLTPPPTVLDPFCGMGTILQEGWIAGYTMLGSDNSPRMIDASQENLAALTPSPTNVAPPTLQHHDARQSFPQAWRGMIDAVVTEPYLGQPLTQPLSGSEAAHYLDSLGELYLAFLKQAYPLLKEEGVVLMALPALRRGSRRGEAFALFPTGFLDAVDNLGYSRGQLIPAELAGLFPSSPRGSLLYARPKALVGRELFLWNKAQ